MEADRLIKTVLRNLASYYEISFGVDLTPNGKIKLIFDDDDDRFNIEILREWLPQESYNLRTSLVFHMQAHGCIDDDLPEQ